MLSFASMGFRGRPIRFVGNPLVSFPLRRCKTTRGHDTIWTSGRKSLFCCSMEATLGKERCELHIVEHDDRQITVLRFKRHLLCRLSLHLHVNLNWRCCSWEYGHLIWVQADPFSWPKMETYICILALKHGFPVLPRLAAVCRCPSHRRYRQETSFSGLSQEHSLHTSLMQTFLVHYPLHLRSVKENTVSEEQYEECASILININVKTMTIYVLYCKVYSNIVKT